MHRLNASSWNLLLEEQENVSLKAEQQMKQKIAIPQTTLIHNHLGFQCDCSLSIASEIFWAWVWLFCFDGPILHVSEDYLLQTNVVSIGGSVTTLQCLLGFKIQHCVAVWMWHKHIADITHCSRFIDVDAAHTHTSWWRLATLFTSFAASNHLLKNYV